MQRLGPGFKWPFGMSYKLPERLVHWPEKKYQSNMYAKIVCDPPLGHATAVPFTTSSVTFTVLIEFTGSPSRNWEVELWHNHSDAPDWQGTPLKEIKDTSLQLLEAGEKPESNVNRRCFQGSLEGKPNDKDVCSFTVRFRSGGTEPWKWIRDRTSLPDGQLCYQKLSVLKHNGLDRYFRNLNPDLTIKEVRVHNPKFSTRTYSVAAPIPGAEGKESFTREWKLGFPGGFSRFVALVRLWAPWLAPRHGQSKFKIDKDAIMVSFLMEDGTHVVLLAVSGIGDTTNCIKSDDSGNIILHGRNDSKNGGWVQLVITGGDSFEEANASAMYTARELVMRNWTPDQPDVLNVSLESKDTSSDDGDVNPKWMQEWYEGFTYCTWNGLGQNLNEDKIFDALKDLSDHNINITNLIIDDNWQSLDHPGEGQGARRWLKFEANKEGFPKGLAYTVSTLKLRNPNLRQIAVWHALLGYWGAIAPDGELAKRYKTMEVKSDRTENGQPWLVIHPDDVPRFYDDFYTFLSDAGINSVKTDAQFALDEIHDAPDRSAMTKVYQDSWSVSMLRHFGAKAISCISQAPQIIFHSQLPNNKPRILVRNSDDFFPNVEDSHPWHVYCNAYNALLTQHLNALPDWDMFQTSHPWAAFHAAARCVSGGPIYFTDTPGQHDINLIHQMTANTVRGDTVILRPSVVGKSTQPYVGYDALRLLRIATYHGYARTGSSILGIFNVAQQSILEIITLNDFSGTEEGLYIMRSHISGQCSKPISREGPGVKFVVADLPVKGYDILTCHSVYGPVKGQKSDKIYLANLGLLGKMTGAAAVINTTLSHDQNWPVKLWTSLKALGILGIYVSDLEDRDIEKDFMVIVAGQPLPFQCVRKGKEENIFEIDIAKAWDDDKWDPGWSNEIVVELLIR